jgi:uncharacterized protein YaiI (UPF0178 family)
LVLKSFKPGSAGIELSYLIDGLQKKIHVGGTHCTDVSLVNGEDLNDSVVLNDRELADSVLVLVRSIADKWEEFKDDAIWERNRERESDVRRRRLVAEQKAASSGNDDKILQTTTSQH